MGSLPLKIGKLKEKPWKKLTRALPNTPTKKVDVIKTLIKSLGPSTKQKVTLNNIASYNAISEETIKLVVSFYEDDSISRVMPGKKDVLSATDKNGTKIKKENNSYLMTFQKFIKNISKRIFWVKTPLGDSCT